MTTSGQQGGSIWTSGSLIYSGSIYPPANTSVDFVARANHRLPGGYSGVDIKLQSRIVGGTIWTDVATKSPNIAGNLVQETFSITVPASARGIQYRVEFPGFPALAFTDPRYSNIITLYPGGRLTGVSVTASPNPLLVGQRSALTIATAPTTAQNATTQLQRQLATPGQWTLAGSANPIRNTPGTETFRATASQTGSGAGGPFTSDEVVVTWLPPLAVPSIPDVVAYRGEAYPISNQLPAATGGISPLTYALTGLPRGLTFQAATRTIQPATIPATAALGAHALTYQVTDSAGNTASQSFTLTIRDRLRLTAPPPYTGDIGVAIPTQASMPAATGGAPPYRYHWADLPAGVTGASAAGQPWYTGTPTAAGAFSATLTATDSAGQNAPRLATFIINDLADPNPTATPGDGQVVLNWTAVPRADRYEVQYATVAAAQAGTAFTTRPLLLASVLTDTVTGLTNGTPYRFRVRGRIGTHNGPWGTVDATPVAAVPPTATPVITAQPVLIEGFPGTTGTYELQATQTGTAPYTLSYALSRTSGWHSITGATLSYTLPAQTAYPASDSIGAYQDIQRNYEVSSDNPQVRSVLATITFRIRKPRAPTVMAPPLVAADLSITVVAGQTAIGELGFVDGADGNPQNGYGPPHTWTATSPPTGFTLTNNSIEWPNVPIAGQPHTITYTVTDRLAQSDTGTITVNVTAAPTAFAIEGPLVVDGQVGESVPDGLIWRVVNATGNVNWTRPTNLPPGIVLNPERGIGRPTQWRASGNYQSAVSNRETVFRATDSASPPNTDDHTTTWNVTRTRPTGGGGFGPARLAPETIRIEPKTTPVSDVMVDGVRRLTYYYGTAPELVVIASIHGRYRNYESYVSGPVYSMDIRGGDRITGNGSISWISQAINALRIAASFEARSDSYNVMIGYGSVNLPYENWQRATHILAIRRPPTGRGVTHGDNLVFPNDITYTARLYDHKYDSHRGLYVPRYYAARHRGQPVWTTSSRSRYRDYTRAKREIADYSLVIRWIPEPLTWASLAGEVLLAEGDAPPSLPMAQGGVPPINYELHGNLPTGWTAPPESISASNVRSGGLVTGAPPAIIGTVADGVSWGIYDLILIATDSAGLRGERQSIVQRITFRTAPASA